jgi:hypothetical protein
MTHWYFNYGNNFELRFWLLYKDKIVFRVSNHAIASFNFWNNAGAIPAGLTYYTYYLDTYET